MRWTYVDSKAKYFEKLDKKKQWHKWFAWHPVVVNREWVWLETISRKGYTKGVSENNVVYLGWNYKSLNDFTK